VLSFCARLEEQGRLDLDACGEFLVLVAALLELKARGLFPEEELELSELEPEQAAEELARRLEARALDVQLDGLDEDLAILVARVVPAAQPFP
jgi:chromatin segregation and condensation protein Rec8/ScpA/Scc1 (kleisin family)